MTIEGNECAQFKFFVSLLENLNNLRSDVGRTNIVKSELDDTW